jgi:hypothetical protein
MGKVLPFTARSHRKDPNKKLAEKMAFEKVLQELYMETGIDFLKLCTGDPHEKMKTIGTRRTANKAALVFLWREYPLPRQSKAARS